MAFSATASAATDQKTIVNPDSANDEVDYTLQQKVEDEEGELLATQFSKAVISEEVAIVNESKLVVEAGGYIGSNPTTLKQKVKDKRGELEATQSRQIEV